MSAPLRFGQDILKTAALTLAGPSIVIGKGLILSTLAATAPVLIPAAIGAAVGIGVGVAAGKLMPDDKGTKKK